ncbi:MAG: NAD(P)-dependent oxidoreductase [Thermodesulfobacteriota bacterium]
MKVFVTGASGFIGAHMIRALISRGHSVMALAMPDDSLWRLQDLTGQFAVVTGVLGEIDTLHLALTEFKPDACIHLAWYAEPGQYLHSTENILSLTNSLSLLKELIQAGCRQVVMAGTCAEYNSDFGYLKENTPTRPATLYAATKLACCLIGQQLAEQANIKFAWGRIFYPYGPQEDERRVVAAAIRALQQGQPFPATPGTQVRDYIYVEDVANAFCTLAENEATGIFNISSAAPVTIRFLLEAIGHLMSCGDLIKIGTLEYRSWEPAFICGDNRKIKKLGWLPKFTITEGLTKTINWWEHKAFNIDR